MSTVAVVTGAGRGLGRRIAERLARRGHRVLVTDIDEAAAHGTAEHVGGGAWAMAQDVRDPASHREVAREAAARSRCGSTTRACSSSATRGDSPKPMFSA